ncbi:MAG: hypothetical protein EPO21_13730 [Chloroflexota bacterium]|nr:MAG: hypothetical protein EPO21_13730 [Chloroflexota bacterium]
MPKVGRKSIGCAAGVLIVILVVVGVIVVRSIQLSQAPTQPIAFSHIVHAQANRIDCLFCHRDAATGQAATVPAVEQCMFCHSVVAVGRPEIQKLRSAWQRQQPINWVRVHRLPDLAHFYHYPHIQAGFDCSVCHGQVQQMAQVRQVRALNMGDCVGCHRQYNAVAECGKCHY